MTAPRLATTRPAALTGRVGQGGENRIHDVALVQALLGLRRAKGGRMYLRDNHVTGKLDRDTALALMQFRLDNGDRNVKSALARTGPIFNKLAQGQALAVLEGTATPYKLATLAEPGEIKSEAAKLLSAERKVALKEVMKAFTQDWGIALNVEIKVAAENRPPRSFPSQTFESRPLVAHFTPRNLWVHNGRNLSNASNSVQFHTRAKLLYEAAAADLKGRCIEAFGITDSVDMKIQNGLKDDLACVVRTDLEGVEALAQFILADYRKRGFTLAAQFFENYLEANAKEIKVSREDALAFEDVQEAVAGNIERFWQNNLIAPKTDQQGLKELEAISKNPDDSVQSFNDEWDWIISSRAGKNIFMSLIGRDVDPQSGSIGFGPGGSNLKSSGGFALTRINNRIAVTIYVTHVWSDDGYNFKKGKLFFEESLVLERHGKAKPFKWTAEWDEYVTGELELIDPFTPNASRRRVGFDALSHADDVSP
jgi:hypothetical protein